MLLSFLARGLSAVRRTTRRSGKRKRSCATPASITLCSKRSPELALTQIKSRGKKIDKHENIADLAQAREMYLKTLQAFQAYRTQESAQRQCEEAAEGEHEIARHRERHVREWQLDELACAGEAAVPLRREDAQRGRHASDGVPRRQYVVDGVHCRGAVCGTGHEGKTEGAVYGVIDRRAAVRIAGHVHHDKVVPALPQRVVAEPARSGEIGEKDAVAFTGARDQGDDQLAPLGAAGVDGERTLALIEAGPVEALTPRRHRPAPRVEPTFERIEPDHVRALLREGHAAQWGRDERRTFDDAKPLKYRVHFPTSQRWICVILPAERVAGARRCGADRDYKMSSNGNDQSAVPTGEGTGNPDTAAPASVPSNDDTTRPLPLSGIRVIDVGTFLAGPYAASIMGEYGAEVLKVEYPIGGDPMRRFGTPTKRHDATLAWLSEARNKKSVTIDLRRPKGVELFIKLVSKSDVLVENFRPGTMEEWGLGWKELSAANPGLVMLRVSGYGQTGPYRRRSGFAHLAHGFGGLSYLAGFPNETPVVPGTAPLGDYFSSLYGVIGVMLALRHKEKTGEGQVIDVGIYEAVFRQMDEMAAAYALFGKIREREGAGTVIAVPHGHFRTRDDKWVAIACTTDKMFERLAEAMERPELSSSGLYGEQGKRLAARGEVNRMVIEWVGSLTRDEVLAKCIDAEVPIGKLNSIADIFEDEHFRARGNLAEIEEEGLGKVVVPGVVPRLSETPGRVTNLGPPLGNGTYEVMRELLELSAAEIASLRQQRII